MMRVIADLCLIPIGVGVSISLETDTPTPIGIKHRSAITRIITFQSYCPSIVRFVPAAGGSLRQRDRVGWPRVLPRWCSGGLAEACSVAAAGQPGGHGPDIRLAEALKRIWLHTDRRLRDEHGQNPGDVPEEECVSHANHPHTFSAELNETLFAKGRQSEETYLLSRDSGERRSEEHTSELQSPMYL